MFIFKPSQSGLSDFLSKTNNMRCPSDVLIPDPIHPHYSQREPQHFNVCYLQLCLLSFPHCSVSKPYNITVLYMLFLSFLLKLFYHKSHLTLFSTISKLLAHAVIKCNIINLWLFLRSLKHLH